MTIEQLATWEQLLNLFIKTFGVAASTYLIATGLIGLGRFIISRTKVDEHVTALPVSGDTKVTDVYKFGYCSWIVAYAAIVEQIMCSNDIPFDYDAFRKYLDITARTLGQRLCDDSTVFVNQDFRVCAFETVLTSFIRTYNASHPELTEISDITDEHVLYMINAACNITPEESLIDIIESSKVRFPLMTIRTVHEIIDND